MWSWLYKSSIVFILLGFFVSVLANLACIKFIYPTLSVSCPADVKDERQRVIKILLKQCARWSTASVQDDNPVVAYLHASYASGYLWALQDAYATEEISHILQTDYDTNYEVFQQQLKNNQDIAVKKGIRVCPQFAVLPEGASADVARIAGEM